MDQEEKPREFLITENYWVSFKYRNEVQIEKKKDAASRIKSSVAYLLQVDLVKRQLDWEKQDLRKISIVQNN